MRQLLDIKVGKAERNGEKHLVLSLIMQDTVIQPAKKELETTQVNMALALFTPEDNVADALRYFAGQIEEGKVEPEKPKLIGI